MALNRFHFIAILFLFAFIGQMTLTISIQKKDNVEYRYADDDNQDSEDEKDEDPKENLIICSRVLTEDFTTSMKTKVHRNHELFRKLDVYFSIDYPPDVLI